MLNIFFGENLKELRLNRKLTQEKLADALGVTFQAISKWERGESYPDNTMLPVISSFFGISVDDLLGINRARTEMEICAILEDYDNLTDKILKKELLDKLIEKAPNDFRVQLREMTYLIHFGNRSEILPRVNAIYERISQSCTSDKIRLSAKRHMAQLYKSLSRFENSGVTMEMVKNLIEDFPSMIDTKEYASTYIYPIEEAENRAECQKTLDKMLQLICYSVMHYYRWEGRHALHTQIEIVEKLISVLNLLNEDGDYGSCWRTMIRIYADAGCLYHKANDDEKTIACLRKCAELAERFDSLPVITERHSLLFEGMKFDKRILGSNYISASEVKQFMTEKYPFSDAFRQSTEFVQIIESLKI